MGKDIYLKTDIGNLKAIITHSINGTEIHKMKQSEIIIKSLVKDTISDVFGLVIVFLNNKRIYHTDYKSWLDVMYIYISDLLKIKQETSYYMDVLVSNNILHITLSELTDA